MVHFFRQCETSFSVGQPVQHSRPRPVSKQARRVLSRRFAMTAFGKEQDLLDVEKRFWDAMKKKDAQTAGKMTDD
jgi:hypothetical protein